jgi:hypothetical protein
MFTTRSANQSPALQTMVAKMDGIKVAMYLVQNAVLSIHVLFILLLEVLFLTQDRLLYQ